MRAYLRVFQQEIRWKSLTEIFMGVDRLMEIRSYVPWLADTEIKRPIAVNSLSNELSSSFLRPKARCAALVLPLLS